MNVLLKRLYQNNRKKCEKIVYKDYPKFDKKEVLEYLRKSRSDDPLLEVEEVLRKHEEILNEYAEKYLGGRVPEENIYREIKSSETIDDRPEMLRLLKAIESPKVKAVSVVEVQRLSRGDLEDAGRIIKLFRYTNTHVITPQKIYDLRDEYDRDAFERELKRGNEYLEYTKKILNRGKLQAVKEGNYIATYPPYGYKKVQYKEGKIKCSTLEIVPAEADVVRMIFDLYVNKDMSFMSIADHLNELHIPAPITDIWKRSAIQEMISNVVYLGKVRWYYRKTVKVIEDQSVVKHNPRSKVNDYLIFDGKHPAIIDEDIFNKAQEKRGKNVPIKKHNNVVNPLAGLFYCERCGKAMKYRQPNAKNLPRFECSEMKYCKCGSALYDDVMERMISVLEDCIEDFTIKMDSTDADELKRHQSLIQTLEARLKELEAKEMRQWEKYSDEKMPKEIFDQLNAKVLKEKEEIKEALCHAYGSVPEPVDYQDKIMSFKDVINALKDPDVSAGAKNKYLKEIIAKITYNREKPIHLTKALAKELGVDYPHKLCWHNYPFTLDITLK